VSTLRDCDFPQQPVIPRLLGDKSIWCRLGLAVDYVEAGKLEQASAQAKEALRINPKITAEDNTYVRSMGIPEERAKIVMALRKAGLD
jgi:hypothetical protein